MKKILLTSILAVIVGTTIVNADNDKTVTSKNYVDTQIGTRQEKIPATGTNASTPGDTVVTYTDTAGTIGERGIYDGSDDYDSSTDADKLVTAAALTDGLNGVQNNLPTVTTSKLTCADSPSCTLWTVADQDVYGEQPMCQPNGATCMGDSACCSGYCVGCHQGMCEAEGYCGTAS
ncbi:MAG: hypothetical protein J5742_01740 [Alphaproteobacteria bacterium]|nr:hypothetical protein [Alphaproteobacteria bacterium]